MFLIKFNNVYQIVVWSNFIIIVLFREKNFVKDSNKDMREKALELLNIANELELRVVKGMTTKKYSAIVDLRPFSSWCEAVCWRHFYQNLCWQTINNSLN